VTTSTVIELDPRAVPYLDAVRDRLGAVPPSEQAELVEDVTSHLEEVAAEDGDDLEARLGPPATYAAEVVAAAGYDIEASTGERGWLVRWTRRRVALVTSARELAPQLRPGWWAIRPFLAVAGLLTLVAGGGSTRNPVAFFVVLVLGAAALPLSLWLGRSGRLRAADLVLTGAAVLGFWAAVVAVQATPVREIRYFNGGEYRPGVMTRADGSPVTNIYAYDSAGKPVQVLLYDQDGRPLDDVGYVGGDGNRYPMDANGMPIRNSYPRAQPLDREAPPTPLAPVIPPPTQAPATTSPPEPTTPPTPTAPPQH
jgi:hypothetical protein